jgi:hypothetical protein
LLGLSVWVQCHFIFKKINFGEEVVFFFAEKLDFKIKKKQVKAGKRDDPKERGNMHAVAPLIPSRIF